jgi:Leucine-rich repeat (LRR) protein
MSNNKLTDVDFLTSIGTLVEINVDYNDIHTLPKLPAETPLETFSAAHNFLEDLDGLAGLQKLNYVNADYNNISSIDVLQSCPLLAQVNVYGTNVHSGGVLEENGVLVNYTPSFN